MLQVANGGQMNLYSHIDDIKVSETLDELMELVSELLPVTSEQYPALADYSRGQTIEFCLRHSALHFSKTAGRLAAYVEDADHGKYAEIQTLRAIVAASLVNSLKLAEEIGLSGPEILDQIKDRFSQHDQVGLQK